MLQWLWRSLNSEGVFRVACATCNLIKGILLAQGMNPAAVEAATPALAAVEAVVVKKAKRKASQYSIRYGRAFKKLASKYKLKSGAWKKNGFRLCAAEARKIARRAN